MAHRDRFSRWRTDVLSVQGEMKGDKTRSPKMHDQKALKKNEGDLTIASIGIGRDRKTQPSTHQHHQERHPYIPF
ncbi:MAG: hypothetical protein AAGA75_18400 [Cyanobacteria bacterium P01_E01_bin.6]